MSEDENNGEKIVFGMLEDSPSIDALILNRAMLYGENFFTSFKWKNGSFQFLKEHMLRLEKSFEFIYKEDFQLFRKDILLKLEELSLNLKNESYFRVTFFRPLNSLPCYFIHQKKLMANKNRPIDRIDLASISKSSSGLIPSFLKLGNYTENFLHLKNAKKRGASEVILFDGDNLILEASTSNIFFVKDEEVYTPKIRPGILDGVWRERIINFFLQEGVKVKEDHLNVSFTETVDEIWLSNSIKELRFISSIGERKLDSSVFLKYSEKFNDYVRKDGQ